ncbi:hypothetical protein ACHAXT_006455 [Thalassiosira profunda]
MAPHGLALLLLWALVLLPRSDGRQLIVGGTEAPQGRYTYAVSLKDTGSGSHFCGGSLVDRSVVLTAAHCVAFDNNFTVVIGRHNLTDEAVGDVVAVAEKVLHPSYNIAQSEDYDVALLFLMRPTTVDVNVVRINSDATIPIEQQAVTYLGWGEIDSDPKTVNTSTTLREVETNVISNERCGAIEGIVEGSGVRESYNGLITNNMICTSAMDKDSCQKDSGGPLIVRGDDSKGDLLVGVSSWGIKCASSVFPGVSARISALYNWIEDTDQTMPLVILGGRPFQQYPRRALVLQQELTPRTV